MLCAKFQGHQPFDSRENIFNGFYHIWAWQPAWSCDMDHLNKISFPHPKEATDKIWLQSAKWLLRKRSLKILNLKDFYQGQSMTLIFGTHNASITHLVNCIYQTFIS